MPEIFSETSAHDTPVGNAVRDIFRQEEMLLLCDAWEVEIFHTPINKGELSVKL